MAKVRQNVDLTSARECWLRTSIKKPLLKARDYFITIRHQKMSLFTNLLLPKNLHYLPSLHTVNTKLLWKGPEQKP